MQTHLVLVGCGVALGLLALWWVRPDTAAGSTFLVLLALLLVQAVGAVGGMIARRLRGPPGPLAIGLLALLAAVPAHAQQPASSDTMLRTLGAAGSPSQLAIINRSHGPLAGVYVSPTGTGGQGPNLLPTDTSAASGRVPIHIPAAGGCVRDIRVLVDGAGSQEWPGVDLCQRHETTLTGNDVDVVVTPTPPGPTAGLRPLLPPPAEARPLLKPSEAALAPAPAPPAPALSVPPAPPLHPARVFMPAASIPPGDVGAYGVMALRATPTPASAARLAMACTAFLAYLPPQSDLPPSVTLPEQMLTVWPLKPDGQADAERGSCQAMLASYDLQGGLDAIRDATSQNRPLAGRGPFLIGWSPSKMRGVPDAVVLVVDMSDFDSQDSFDQAFLFWQRKIVEDPALWRSGFSGERLRLAVRDFVDHYGTSIEAAIKIWSGGGG